MLVRVRPDSPVPIYEQIVTQLIHAVAADEVPAGELIPSVRELAQRSLVHPNTVARAFQELERAGVLEAKRGRGMAVTPRGKAIAVKRRKSILQDRIRDALREAIAGQLTSEEVHQLVEEEWGRLNGSARRPSQ